MRTMVSAVLGIVAIAAGEARALAGDWNEHLTLTVSDRVRGEFVDWFQPPAGKAPAGAQRYNFIGNQFRFGAQLDLPQVLFTLQMQDTRLVSLPDDASPPVVNKSVGNLGPGAQYFFHTHRRDQGEPFLRLGSVTLRHLNRLPNLSFTGGRFEYFDGLETIPTDPALAWLKRTRVAERLVGTFGYTHVGRTFDGVRLAYDPDIVNVTAFATRPTQGGFEVSANRELTDVGVAGLTLTLKELADLPPTDARVFYLYYRDARDVTKVDNRQLSPAQDVLRQKDRKPISIHTAGIHAVTVADAGPGKIDGLVWAAVQGGDWGELGHFAWAYALESGYQLPQMFAAPWLRVGYNRSSGDDNPNDKTHETFFQILPTARSYAQFPFYNLMNNEDLFAQVILKPSAQVTVRSDYHWLRLTASNDLWYSGGGADNDQVFGFTGLGHGPQGHELAHVVDLSVTAVLFTQLTAYAYYGRAFGQEVVKQTFSGTAANFGYVEITFRY